MLQNNLGTENSPKGDEPINSIAAGVLRQIIVSNERFKPDQVLHYKEPIIWERFNRPGTISVRCLVDETERNLQNAKMPEMMAKVAKECGARLIECHVTPRKNIVPLDEIRTIFSTRGYVLTQGVDSKGDEISSHNKTRGYTICVRTGSFFGANIRLIVNESDREKIEALHARIVALIETTLHNSRKDPDYEATLKKLGVTIRKEAKARGLKCGKVEYSPPYKDDEPYGHGD